MSRHLICIVLVWLVVTAIYARVSGSYYCGYDDFLETHRAAFEDARNPSRIFTTTHFNTPKYRPLSRGLSFVSYWTDHGDPIAYRLRNLAFHLLGVAAVYGLGWLLFQSWEAAAAAALVFGLHPLANQAVVAACFNNPAANFFLLATLFLFIYSLHAKGHSLRWLGVSLLCSLLALFIYESSVVVFALMYGYLAILWLRNPKAIDRRFLYTLTAGAAVVAAFFLGSRLLAVRVPARPTPPGLLVKNTVMYAGALLLPVDTVLAHDLFGAPLPSEMRLNLRSPILWLAALVAVMAVAALALWVKKRHSQGVKLDWPILLFLAAAGGVSLTPFLVFNAHPSETYLPLPAAFYSLALSAALWRLIASRWKYIAVIGVLAILFGAATWMRNQRVAACGAIAQRILREMPVSHWVEGDWLIHVSNAPGQEPLPRYGVYSYQGVSTIEPPDPSLGLLISPLQCALQMATRNEKLRAMVTSPAAMPSPCPREGTCFWISDDGHVSQAESLLPTR